MPSSTVAAKTPAGKPSLYLVKDGEGKSAKYLICQSIGELKPDDAILKGRDIDKYLASFRDKIAAAPLPQFDIKSFAFTGPTD